MVPSHFMLRCRQPLPPRAVLHAVRWFSRVAPPSPVKVYPVIRVSNNVASLGEPKEGPKPRQLLSLPPFPSSGTHPFPGRKKVPGSSGKPRRVTAISWVKHYFADIEPDMIQNHFNKGLVHVENSNHEIQAKENNLKHCLEKIKHNHVMEPGMKIHLPVSVAETKIIKRYDTIPTATLHPNADEIEYIRRLVMHKDSAVIVLNKPPKVPVKGNLPVHNSMDVLAAAALSYGSDQGPKLVHRLDRESSGLLLMGRTKESFTQLHWLFTNVNLAKSSSEIWNNACEATTQRYWALVIGSPKEREGIISAPLTKVFLNDGKAERIILAHPSGIDGSQEAITEYRVMGPTINGCSWVELRPVTGRKHQLRVHCAEALGTPIVGDYKYGWFVHKRWKQMPRADYEPLSGEPYKMRRTEGLEVQKGSVLSKVPLLHLHCREMVIPNISKFFSSSGEWLDESNPRSTSKPDLLRFVAPMPSHMKISWNLMSSYLV
ncbi:RNA pseudouridine synthase 3, mitochondrial [Canna indica]|uniref:RNA pseudouridine synthase 3, mitochondrial n=1 Tax=Canna indica TaxID=4628 RepID=A0AAQ3JNJ2_9LILI|nr:RNA pseudouridine synthase 3, mitochondrial [Canna indica]